MSFINRLFNTSNVGGAGRSRSGGPPQAMRDAAAAQRAAHSGPTRGYDGVERDLGNTSNHSLPPKGFSPILRQMANRPDAGNAIFIANNATVHTLKYAYTSHKPMEAWLENPPADGKLSFCIAISPSIHAGSNRSEKLENYKKFGKTNIYNLEVIFPDGKREHIKFDVEGNKDPKRGYEASKSYTATLSPDIEIDLDKYKGQDVKIRGWADGSAGVGGYQERRETVLHL